MTLIRALFAGLVALMLLGSTPASAAEWKDFTAGDFAAAKSAGKPILVDVFAAWCPVCRAQNPILVQLTKEPKYKDLVVFKLDYDKQKADLISLRVQRQSTLILFKGGQEQERIVGAVSKDAIAKVVGKYVTNGN